MSSQEKSSQSNHEDFLSALNADQLAEYRRQLEILQSNVVEITPQLEFCKMLAKSIAQQIPLRVKCGIDPTVSDIHLGHLVPFKKMRQFQDLGHIGVVIIGDFTAQIGDPSGKNETRPVLTPEQTQKNAESYMDQVHTVLDREKTEIRKQSEWFTQVSLQQTLGWAMETTAAKLLGHDTFRTRFDQGQSLGLHELFYPVLQGMDSVFVKADIELGGTDQKFNVLMGRDYQKNRSQRPQVAFLLPLVMGLCGTAKMSKSLGNTIAVNAEPFDMFGKVMSIPDKLMEEYHRYIAGTPAAQVDQILEKLQQGQLHPNLAKKDLAQKVVGNFYGEETAQEMRRQFEKVFAKKQVPDQVPEYRFKEGLTLIDLLVESQLCSSRGEARRMIGQNAVSVVDGDKLQDASLAIDQSFFNRVIKVGKRKFVKIRPA